MDDVVKGLINVHNNIDIPAQWERAVLGLSHMSNMEIARTWVLLLNSSMPKSDLNGDAIRILYSYKTLFKRALKDVKARKAAYEIQHNNSFESFERQF